MPGLQLRSISARWHNTKLIGGHGGRRTVSLSLETGQWLWVTGENGVGKSTLLHAIAGLVSFVTGDICVDGRALAARDVGARFREGVQLVPQNASLAGSLLSAADAVSAALFARPALDNTEAIRKLERTCEDAGWNLADLTERQFDLLAALVAVPRILLLDEVGPLLNERLTYLHLKQLMPRTVVVFTDHKYDRAYSAMDKVLWLRNDAAPTCYSKMDLPGQLRKSEWIADEDDKEAGDESGLLLLRDRSAAEQICTALRTLRMTRQDRERMIARLQDEAPFLADRRPAEELSGGQTILVSLLLNCILLRDARRVRSQHLSDLHHKVLQKLFEIINGAIDNAKSD